MYNTKVIKMYWTFIFNISVSILGKLVKETQLSLTIIIIWDNQFKLRKE